ncbi:MAG: pilus assembly protein TadG-related protein [Planctomycetaceae bacterium]
MNRLRPASPGSHDPARRGLSTIWVIIAIPAVMTMFVAVVDIGHIWLARNELKNALDAATLSGIKTWAEGGTTAQSRLDADNAMATNTILGTAITLDTTEGGCTNGNVASTGELVLGVVTDNDSQFTFDCNQPPCPAATIVFAIDTSGTGDTFVDANAFRIVSFTAPAGSTLNSVSMDLASIRIDSDPSPAVTDAADNGMFDFRTPVAADATSGQSNAVVTGTATGGAMISSTTAGGSLQSALQIDFSSFDPGDTLFFGIDTDEVGPIAGVTDTAGEFGTGFTSGMQSTLNGLEVTVDVNGIVFSDRMTFQNNNLSQGTLTFNLSTSTGFAIRARTTIQINSISSTFLGLGLGPYPVTAESFAMSACPQITGGPPRLLHNGTFTCTCP